MKAFTWVVGFVAIVALSAVAQAKTNDIGARYRLYDLESHASNSKDMASELGVADSKIKVEIETFHQALATESVQKQAAELLKRFQKIDANTKHLVVELARDDGGLSVLIRPVDEDKVSVSGIPYRVAGLDGAQYKIAANDLLKAFELAAKDVDGK